MTFKDLFSERAPLYSRYRPEYPAALFQWLATLVTRHDKVWDCATGNGQAARSLARIFATVVATDASAEQIAQATPDPSIEYRVARADASGLPPASVNMVTIAQAIHWIDFDPFYTEVKRVLTPDGAFVVWGYGDPVMETEALERVVHTFNRGTIEEYWMPERKIILDGYSTMPFPFREIPTPELYIECRWTLAELSGYMRTWSATAAYVRKHGGDPVATVEADLAPHWGGNEYRRLVRWPLHIRAGYMS